jgi:DNA repair ATPase RecN
MASALRQSLYSFDFPATNDLRELTTEYEDLLRNLIDERNAKLAELSSRKGKEKDIANLMSDIKFLEVELQRYQQSMSLFRTKGVPKVGRWGKPETAEEVRE